MKTLFFLDKVPSRWIRIAAQGIDYALFYLFLSLTSLFLPFYIEDLYYLGFAFFIPLFWIPLEALLLARYKTTPGKAIFGVRVENHLGGRLPWWVSLKRASFLGTRPGVIRQKGIRWGRGLLGAILLFALVGSAYFEKEITALTTGFEKYRSVEGWIDYTATSGEFRVLLPEEPQESSKILPVPSHNKELSYQELTSHQTKKVYYSISYMQLPKSWKLAGANRLLQGALSLIIEHSAGAELLSQSFTRHRAFKALDFHISQGSEEVRGRLILVGMTLYRLTMVYPPELAHQLQQEEFLNSFQIQG